MVAWGRHDDAETAVGRILDAAGRVHLRKGVRATTMADVAGEAGCSRATLYLYFANRGELRAAVRNRAALHVAQRIVDQLDPDLAVAERITTAAVLALDLVRSSPELMVWFDEADAGLTHELATSSEVISAIAIGLTDGAEPTATTRLGARLLVRIIVSYLMTPDAENERPAIAQLVNGIYATPPARPDTRSEEPAS